MYTVSPFLSFARWFVTLPTSLMLRSMNSSEYDAIDIGANHGLFTILMSKTAPGGKVYSFEPEKHSYNKLINNVSNIPNVKTFNIALGDEEKEVELYFNLDNDGGHALWDPAVHPDNSKTKSHDRIKQIVQMKTLDSIIDIKPKVIKIDTEGCELLIIKGAKNLIEKYKPIIITEINYIGLTEMGTSPVEFQKYMESIGYRCYSLPERQDLDLSIMKRSWVINVLFKPVD